MGGVPLARLLSYVVFTLWVSLCAFAPELIWQGMRLLHGHFGAAELLSALFIGALLVFFVDPLVERLKFGRWHLPHQAPGGLLLGTLVALLAGAAVVCIHEAIGAWLHGGHGEAGDKLANLAHALAEVQEWASIPAAVTAAWFVAGRWPRLAWPALGAALAWILAVGLLYGWSWRGMVITAIPCGLIAIFGVRRVRRGWDAGTFPALARLTALIAAAWLVFALVLRLVVQQLGGPDVYVDNGLADDCRFYLGWTLGLFVAPNPLEEEQDHSPLGNRPARR